MTLTRSILRIILLQVLITLGSILLLGTPVGAATRLDAALLFIFHKFTAIALFTGAAILYAGWSHTDPIISSLRRRLRRLSARVQTMGEL